jgi:hypothetical protein
MNKDHVVISASSSRKKILFGAGIVLFIFGFVELIYVTWILFSMQFEIVGRISMGMGVIVGLILESAGILSIVLSKFEK